MANYFRSDNNILSIAYVFSSLPLSLEDRSRFVLKEFSEKYGLGAPVGGTFFKIVSAPIM